MAALPGLRCAPVAALGSPRPLQPARLGRVRDSRRNVAPHGACLGQRAVLECRCSHLVYLEPRSIPPGQGVADRGDGTDGRAARCVGTRRNGIGHRHQPGESPRRSRIDAGHRRRVLRATRRVHRARRGARCQSRPCASPPPTNGATCQCVCATPDRHPPTSRPGRLDCRRRLRICVAPVRRCLPDLRRRGTWKCPRSHVILHRSLHGILSGWLHCRVCTGRTRCA